MEYNYYSWLLKLMYMDLTGGNPEKQAVLISAFKENFSNGLFPEIYKEYSKKINFSKENPGLDNRINFIFDLLQNIEINNDNLKLIAATIEMFLYMVAPPMFTSEEIKRGTVFEHGNTHRAVSDVSIYESDKNQGNKNEEFKCQNKYS